MIVIIENKIPIKNKDLGCPTISITSGETHIETTILDLRACVIVLSYSVYKQFGLGELKPTNITLSLADRSIRKLRGIVEDLLEQVDTLYYLVDFVVLEIKQSTRGINNIPIILGRHFLATSNALINCRNGLMKLTFGKMTMEVNIFDLVKKLESYGDDPMDVFVIDSVVEEHVDDFTGYNP